MNRRGFLKLAGALLVAPSAAKLISLEAPAAASSTTMTLSCGPPHYFRVGDMLRFDETGEIVRVVGIRRGELDVV